MGVFLNRYLELLTEASKPKKKTDEDPDAEKETRDAEAADAEDTEEGTDNQDDNPEGGDEETDQADDSEPGDEAEAEDEGNNEDEGEAEEGSEESGNEGEDASENEDDFSLDPEGGEDTDNDPPPDGLTDPDDDGSGDTTTDDENAEVNVQVNVLNLSKLDRLLLKRRCLSDYYDLRTSINTFRNIIDKNEASIDPDVREIAVRDLNQLYTRVSEYLMYKFSTTNYEENLQNYLLFMRSINDIVKTVDQNGQKGGKKS